VGIIFIYINSLFYVDELDIIFFYDINGYV